MNSTNVKLKELREKIRTDHDAVYAINIAGIEKAEENGQEYEDPSYFCLTHHYGVTVDAIETILYGNNELLDQSTLEDTLEFFADYIEMFEDCEDCEDDDDGRADSVEEYDITRYQRTQYELAKEICAFVCDVLEDGDCTGERYNVSTDEELDT